MWRIGVDEAGRGPVIGPLVVAAFACPENDVELLKQAGVRDSKDLTAERRLELSEWILKESEVRGWSLHIHTSTAAAIDNAMQRSDLNQHECDLFALCSDVVIQGLESGILRLDACDINQKRFGDNVCARMKEWPKENWQVVSEHKADSNYPVVAAASILAKQTRDEAIEKLSNIKGFELGSGYPSDPTTRAAVRRLIVDGIPDDCIRWRWKTCEDICIEEYGQRPPTRPPVKDGAPEPAQRTLF